MTIDDENPQKSERQRVSVLFPLPLPKPYDYLAPHGAVLQPGTFVKARFGPRLVWGTVWPATMEEKPLDIEKLKAIDSVSSAPPLSESVIDFVNWVAQYTMFPLGAVLRLVMRSGDGLDPPKGRTAYRLGPPQEFKQTTARTKIIDFVKAQENAQTVQEIAAGAGVTEGPVRALAKLGVLEQEVVDPDPPYGAPQSDHNEATLSEEQARATAGIAARIAAGGPSVTLIDGVTGSGKTEVYLEAIAKALTKDPDSQVLLMLPEIALTLPFLKRVEQRFGVEPAGWHSEISASARRRVWRRVNEGQARLVVGARSALFLPFRKLSLIVVDEEHESAYKQEDGVIYQARDMAVLRGARSGFPVVLASATPSLETVINVDQERYELARLRNRYGAAELPEIRLVDLKKNGPEADHWIAPDVVTEVNERIARGEQSLLFLNRRGYAPLTICRKCGYRMKSPDSDTWLVEHRFENRLVCHHTGYSIPKPDACPTCKAVGALAACGPGVERVAEEAKRTWPDARLEILSSDIVRSASAMKVVLEKMAAGEIDILVATQMVAKGHHFPKLTLVAAIDADMGLAGGDLRAAERTFQMISQVTGRAGRELVEGQSRGLALLQTYDPTATVLTALATNDRDAFLAAEAQGRAEQGFPPFGRLAAIIFRGPDEKRLRETVNAHKEALIAADGVEVWGPAPAPFYRLRGQYRMRFLVKVRRDVHLQAFLKAWLSNLKVPSQVRRAIDIDPYSFL